MSELTLEKWLNTDDKACADIVRKKYLIPKELLGHEETVNEFLDRVSMGNDAARKLILNRKFIPGGRILAGMDLYNRYGIKVSYSNCYVLTPPEDNIPSIYEKQGEEGITFSRGGGVGFDISPLAPRGAKVKNSSQTSTGAVSFIPSFSNVAEQIGQNGRRGALLLSMNDRHPDLEEFITHKRDLNITNGANLSVMVSDEFMEAVENDYDWLLTYCRVETNEVINKTVKARHIMRLIAEMNWEMAEPGMLFWDNFKRYHIMSEDPDFEYAGTNPCGEEPLPAGGACLLGAMNLSEYYNELFGFFDATDFANDVQCAIRYLDSVLTAGVDLHPLQYQKDAALNYRQIGLGVMGIADLFIKKNIIYGSDESIKLIHDIGYIMAFEAIRASTNMAAEMGSFPKCNNDLILESSFIRHNVLDNPLYNGTEKSDLMNHIHKYGLRNSALLTCAPTGTISTIFNVSGGIEPLFAKEYERTTKTVYGKEKAYIAHPAIIQRWLKDNNLTELPDELPKRFVTAREIPWEERINVQSALQEHIDASISSTINLPEDTTVEEIEDLYVYAYTKGCKGITVFRENCNRKPILKDTTKKDDNKETSSEPKKEIVPMIDNPLEFQTADLKEMLDPETYAELEKATYNTMQSTFPFLRSCANEKAEAKSTNKKSILTRADFGEKLPSTTYYKRVACGHVYIIISRYNDMPVEVFMESAKSGGCSANTTALGRLASTMLRAGVDVEYIVDSIIGVKCAACSSSKGKGEDISGLSCADVLARVVKEEYESCLELKKVRAYIEAKENPEEHPIMPNPDTIKYKKIPAQETIDNDICPDCGSRLILAEGCRKCMNCGYSRC